MLPRLMRRNTATTAAHVSIGGTRTAHSRRRMCPGPGWWGGRVASGGPRGRRGAVGPRSGGRGGGGDDSGEWVTEPAGREATPTTGPARLARRVPGFRADPNGSYRARRASVIGSAT